jgi:putative nucleotidyltransferase with HDIG domain
MDQNLQAIIINVMYGKSVSLRDHSLQTAEISLMLVSRLLSNDVDVGCSPDDVYSAGLLHDIGKLYVSEAILNKPAGLDERETENMRLHTSWGLDFVEGVDGLERFANVVAHHHENAFGTGYPHGLCGEDLDPLTKIVHIADVLSALLEDRPYRRGIVDDQFILAKMEQDLKGLFNGSSGIIWNAIVEYLAEYRRKRKFKPTSPPAEIDNHDVKNILVFDLPFNLVEFKAA